MVSQRDLILTHSISFMCTHIYFKEDSKRKERKMGKTGQGKDGEERDRKGNVYGVL